MIACSAFSFAFQMDAAKETDNKCKYAHCPASNKGIGDAGSTADLRMLWSVIVCL